MNPKEINKRIAIACGYEKIYHVDDKVLFSNGREVVREEALPNYYEDLNAMHEAEKGMENQQWWKFVDHLIDICGGGTALGISATAAQRAEAFLHTIEQ